LQELKIAAGQFWRNDLSATPQEDRTVGSARPALAISESRENLLTLLRIELLSSAEDRAGLTIILHDPPHVQRRCVVRAGSGSRRSQRRQASPEIERIGQLLEPDFLR